MEDDDALDAPFIRGGLADDGAGGVRIDVFVAWDDLGGIRQSVVAALPGFVLQARAQAEFHGEVRCTVMAELMHPEDCAPAALERLAKSVEKRVAGVKVTFTAA